MLILDNDPKEKNFLELRKKICNENFYWNFLPHTSFHLYKDGRDYQLNHLVFFNDQIKSPLFEEVSNLIKSSLSPSFEVDKFLLIKISALTNVGQQLYCKPIIYHPIPHKIGFLYINSCDGGTLVFKDKYDEKLNLSPADFREKVLLNRLDDLSDVKSVDNRVLVFDGFNYHSCYTPTETKMFIMISFTFV